MKRLVILFAAAFMMAAIFPISAGAGDNGTTLTANLLDLRVFGKSSPPGTKFYVSYGMRPPGNIDSLEIRYEKTGNYTQYVTQVLKGPQPLLSPSTLPVLRGGPTTVTFWVDIPFGDTNSILLSVYYKGQPIDSMGMSFYREGDSVIFSRQTFPPPPAPPREPSTNSAYPFEASFDLISGYRYPGPAELRFTLVPLWRFDSMHIEIAQIGNLVYHGQLSYSVPIEIGQKNEFILPVTIPPDDTSGIDIRIYVNGHRDNTDHLWFVTTNDTVEVYKSKPIGPRVTPPRTQESPRPYNPLFTELAPATLPAMVGDLDLQLRVRPGKEFDSILFKVVPLGNIEYHGDSIIHVPTDTGHMNEYRLPVTIPPNDTTGINLAIIAGDDVTNNYAVFFISTRDSVKVEYINPAPEKLQIKHFMRILPLPKDQDQNKPSIQILKPPAHPKKFKTNDSILKIPRKDSDGGWPRFIIAVR